MPPSAIATASDPLQARVSLWIWGSCLALLALSLVFSALSGPLLMQVYAIPASTHHAVTLAWLTIAFALAVVLIGLAAAWRVGTLLRSEGDSRQV